MSTEDREKSEKSRELALDANKHMSTLSATALALIFAASEIGGIKVNVGVGVAVFGLSLVAALFGMRNALVSEWVSGDNRRAASRSSEGYFLLSLTTFLGGVLLVLVYPAVT